MSEVKNLAGGAAVPSTTLVQTDQVSILGDGSHDRPLRTAAGGVGVVTDGTTILGDGTSGDPLRTNPGEVPVSTDGTTILGDGTSGDPIRLNPALRVTTTLQVDGSSFQVSDVSPFDYGLGDGVQGGADVAGLASFAVAPLNLPRDATIHGITLFVSDNASGPTTLQASLQTLSSIAVAAVIASSALTDGTGANQQLLIADPDEDVLAGFGYRLVVAATAGVASWSVHLAQVVVEFPPGLFLP